MSPSIVLDLPDDIAALREARWMAIGAAIEIWCDDRLVQRVGPSNSSGQTQT